jgi:hypothetical protein
MTPTYNRAVPRGRDTLRAAALVAVGWWVVHQLRYLLAFGAEADGVLHREGHAYLEPAGPALTTLLAFAAARLLVRTAASVPEDRSTRAQRLLVVWPVCSTALLALYTAQESIEGLLAAGHPGGLAGVFGQGGWIAVPLAILAGLAIAAALRISARLETLRLVVLGELSDALPRPLAAVLLPAPFVAVPAPALARPGAGRAPPAVCR